MVILAKHVCLSTLVIYPAGASVSLSFHLQFPVPPTFHGFGNVPAPPVMNCILLQAPVEEKAIY